MCNVHMTTLLPVFSYTQIDVLKVKYNGKKIQKVERRGIEVLNL